MGLKPSDQPQADQLMNPNINTLDSVGGGTGENATQYPDDGSEEPSDDQYLDDPMQTPISQISQ